MIPQGNSSLLTTQKRSKSPYLSAAVIIVALLASSIVGKVMFFKPGNETLESGSPRGAGTAQVASSVQSENPVNGKVSAMIAEAEDLKAKSRFAEAVGAYEKVIQERPDLAEPYFRLGALYFNLGLRTKAEEQYLKAIEKDYNNPEIYFHLGYIKESEEKFQEALEWYLKAEERGVGSAELYYNIGNVFARLNNSDQAVEYYKKAVVVNPRHMDAFINLSIVSFQKGGYTAAADYLAKAKELGYAPPDDYSKALAEKMLER